MLDISVTPFRFIGKIGREKMEDQPYELSSSEGKCSFMLMLPHFLIFFPIIFSEHSVTSSHSIRCFSEVISEVFISRLRHSFIFSSKEPGLFFWPDKTCEFSELVMGLKSSDISNFSDDSCGQYFTNAWDGSEGIGERFKFFRYSFINFSKVPLKGSDSMDKISQDKRDSSGKFGTETVRFSDCFLDKLGYFERVRASIFTFFRDKRGEFGEGKTDEFFWGERGEQSGDSMASERFHRFRLNHCGILEKEIGEKGINFPNNSLHQVVSIASEGSKRGIRVIGDMRKRKGFGESEVVSEGYSIGFICFIKFRKRFTKAVDTESIKPINFGCKGRKFFRLSQEISKMPVIDAGRFSSDGDRRYRFWRFEDELKEEVEERTSSRRSIRKGFRFRDCISQLISDKRDKLFGIHIQSNKKGTHYFTSFTGEEEKKEEESWLPGYRAASRISTLKVQRSVSRLYPGPGGLTLRSKLKCKENKPIPVFSPSKEIFTRILPFLQYKVKLSLS